MKAFFKEKINFTKELDPPASPFNLSKTIGRVNITP